MDTLLSTHRRRLLKSALSIGALGAGSLALLACNARRATAFMGETMGTTWQVKIADAGIDEALRNALRAQVQAAFDDVDARMSLFRAESELVAFNRHRGPAPFALSPELFDVFSAARETSALSEGAFDITVAPLVEHWGFGTNKHRSPAVPAPWRGRYGAIDYRALRLDARTRGAIKANTDVQADLGGIAKGYGVDRAARVLDALGFAHTMVEAGGELRTRGRNAAGEPWQIGIEQPDATPQRARWVVPLDGMSMATSGDYRIYFEAGGVRYSHEIDPRSAAPIAHRLCSVTVIAADCLRADALATALIVMGPQRGFALAQALGIAALFIERESAGRYVDRSTTAFAALGPRRIG
jgi:thiamine biosynthesis lipoprotein